MQKAEKATSQTIRDVGEHAREAAGQTQESTTRTAEGVRDYQLKLISAAQDHANALFEYAQRCSPGQFDHRVGRAIDLAHAAAIRDDGRGD
jgi:hypothetical protein